MLDNLRRTLSAPASVAALLAGWTLPLPRRWLDRFVCDDRAADAAAGARGDRAARADHGAQPPARPRPPICGSRCRSDALAGHVSSRTRRG
jgi:hypothetical protein